MPTRSHLCVLIGLALVLGASGRARAAEAEPSAPAGSGRAVPELPVDVTGDRMIWDGRSEQITFVGSASARYGAVTLGADRITYDQGRKLLQAVGNVRFQRGEELFETDRLTYRIDTGEVTSGAYQGYEPPVFVRGSSAERQPDGAISVEEAAATTCELPRPHTRIEARRVLIYPDDYLIARQVYFMLGDRAIFYLPYYKKSLGDRSSNFSFVPGYSSRFGPFLLTAYRWAISPLVTTVWHLDYRAKRGPGGGLDVKYRTPDNAASGLVSGYYANDDDPIDDEDIAAGQEIDQDRYRLRLQHRQDFTAGIYGLVDATYLSDPDVEEDFFESDFRRQIQPDSFANVVKAAPDYTLSLLVRPQVNDFYNVVERLPDLSFETRRLRIADSPFYYRTESSAANLRARFEEGSGVEDYESIRLDTLHQVFYPKKYFGWLNLVPRAHFRATYYDETRREERPLPGETNQLYRAELPTVYDEFDRVLMVSTNQFPDVEGGGGDTRLLYGVGLESFFRGYRMWDYEDNYYNLHGLRHVVEPSADYYFTAEPDLTPDEIYQFDPIDMLGEENFVRWGLRNKLQTKRRDVPHDLVDFFVYTDWRLDPQEDQSDFSSVYFDNELRPTDRFWMDNDWAIDSEEGDLTYFNTYLRYALDRVNLGVGHRYRMDYSSLFSTEVEWAVTHNWGLRAYHRFEAEEGELEEQEYTIYRNLHCWDGWFSVRERDGDLTAWVVLSLKAFPSVPISIGK